jgi:hypothetical protein
VTEIGEEADFAAVGAKHEANGIVGIVGNGKRFNANLADFESGTGAEKAQMEFGGFKLKFDRFLGEAIAENGDGKLVAESAEAVGMVGMFVSKENAAETFGSPTDLRETFANLFGAETGIDEKTGIAILEVGAIAVGAAAKDRELNRH